MSDIVYFDELNEKKQYFLKSWFGTPLRLIKKKEIKFYGSYAIEYVFENHWLHIENKNPKVYLFKIKSYNDNYIKREGLDDKIIRLPVDWKVKVKYMGTGDLYKIVIENDNSSSMS